MVSSMPYYALLLSADFINCASLSTLPEPCGMRQAAQVALASILVRSWLTSTHPRSMPTLKACPKDSDGIRLERRRRTLREALYFSRQKSGSVCTSLRSCLHFGLPNLCSVPQRRNSKHLPSSAMDSMDFPFSRLEAIALRLEAIALRLEAIALNVGS